MNEQQVRQDVITWWKRIGWNHKRIARMPFKQVLAIWYRGKEVSFSTPSKARRQLYLDER